MRWVGIIGLALSFIGVVLLAFVFKEVPISQVKEGLTIAILGEEMTVTVRQPDFLYIGWGCLVSGSNNCTGILLV